MDARRHPDLGKDAIRELLEREAAAGDLRAWALRRRLSLSEDDAIRIAYALLAEHDGATERLSVRERGVVGRLLADIVAAAERRAEAAGPLDPVERPGRRVAD